MKFEPYQRRIIKLTRVNGAFYYKIQYSDFLVCKTWFNLTDDEFSTFAAAA